jgi:hypothetical protein
MKKIGDYTVRGKLSETESVAGASRIQLFEGRFDTAFKVKEFYIWPSSVSAGTTGDLVGKLATESGLNNDGAGFFNAADSREIAWAGTSTSEVDAWSGPINALVDPDNLIVQDLFVYVRGILNAAPANYMVVMEKYDVGLTQGTYSMVRNSAQNFPTGD